MSTGAAFFDLDRTLVSGSSAFAFAVAAWRNDLVPSRALLKDAAGALDLDGARTLARWLQDRPEITRLVVGVRKRSPVGKAVLGSIAQRLILESTVPVLSVKSADA